MRSAIKSFQESSTEAAMRLPREVFLSVGSRRGPTRTRAYQFKSLTFASSSPTEEPVANLESFVSF